METPWLIVGLGNPGRGYERTRHNAGFMVLETLGSRWKAVWGDDRRFSARLAVLRRHGKKIYLCQPQTYMNASGEAVGPVAAYFKVPPEQLLVVVDDADLVLGQIRMRPGGSSGGHHGLDSVERHLGTRSYPRQRIGIGRGANQAREITDHVLSPVAAAERDCWIKVLERACDQIDCWLTDGVAQAMNRYNGLTTNEEN